MASRLSCPQCGTKTTLKTLQDEIEELKLRESAQIRRANIIASNGTNDIFYDSSIDHLSIGQLKLVTETCVSCGTHYDPLARNKAADACNKLETLRSKVLSPLEALAHASNPSLLEGINEENSVPTLRREADIGDDEVGGS